MFARVFALLPLALLATASPLEARDQCSGGSISCCNSVQQASQLTTLLTTLGAVEAAQSAGGLVGVTCSAPTLIGTSQGCAASQQQVCCTNNQFNGVVNVGCTPINVNA